MVHSAESSELLYVSFTCMQATDLFYGHVCLNKHSFRSENPLLIFWSRFEAHEFVCHSFFFLIKIQLGVTYPWVLGNHFKVFLIIFKTKTVLSPNNQLYYHQESTSSLRAHHILSSSAFHLALGLAQCGLRLARSLPIQQAEREAAPYAAAVFLRGGLQVILSTSYLKKLPLILILLRTT